ncbi:HAD-IB family hydrolase [Pseudomonas sp. NPDC098747]|uniref:HAD-IB family hydrolase n=1 Tax=Pseudomonas sp. NPDC098747 TaxID=3364487 RepID=UPI00383BC96B
MKEQIDNSTEQQRPVLAVFDFDGTLTRHDSFVPFLKFAFGTREFNRLLLRLALPSLRFVVRRMNRDELKAQLIRTFLTGVKLEWLQQQAASYCALVWPRLMRPSGLLAIEAEINSGAVVTLCSASPALVLQPFAERLGVKLIGTELEVVDGVLTGHITGDNCRCANKVMRLEAVYGVLQQFRVKAWGDTRGDHELLAAAEEPHWRHFHPVWRRGRLRITNGRNPGVRAAQADPHVASTSDRHMNTDDQQGA